MAPAWLLTTLDLLRTGSETRWWGLLCPPHCQGPGLGSLLAAFLAGILVTLFSLALILLLLYSGPLRSFLIDITTIERPGRREIPAPGPSTGLARRRLAGYLQSPQAADSGD